MGLNHAKTKSCSARELLSLALWSLSLETTSSGIPLGASSKGGVVAARGGILPSCCVSQRIWWVRSARELRYRREQGSEFRLQLACCWPDLDIHLAALTGTEDPPQGHPTPTHQLAPQPLAYHNRHRLASCRFSSSLWGALCNSLTQEKLLPNNPQAKNLLQAKLNHASESGTLQGEAFTK
eukprot:5113415-Amphidinium_carterae.1